jgi:uncharacterized damage-inducible protein DinB
MSHATQLRSLVDYNRWANERILAASEAIPDEQFARDDADGLSLQGALLHAVRTQLWWLGNWTDVQPPRYERSRDGLRRAYSDSHDRLDALVAETDDAGWERMIDFAFQPGAPLRLPMWQTFTQVMMHGIQHRAEAAVLLTHAGHSPGNMDYILWLLDRV